MSDRGPRRDERKIHIPAPDPERAAAPGTSVFGPAVAPPAARPSPEPARPRARPAQAPARPATTVAPARSRGRRRRPRLRRLLLLTSLALPLLLLLSLLGGYLYARSVYDRVEKIPLADVLGNSARGTNYLIVGSDSRNLADIVDAGLDPAAFDEGSGGERSDTILVLRFVDGGAKMMSIPRDLYLPIAEIDRSSKINAAYNGGPRRLVLTVQQSLGIQIDHYMEVDFVSFARLVDSLGGITIDFPNPAFDKGSGLDVTEAGPTKLDGPQALAFVRSRHFVEVIDGEQRADPTADLGRVKRQQLFLKTVFGKIGSSKNPIKLASAAGSTTGGLRVDDTLSLTDAITLAWRLRSLNPVSIELPVEPGSNSSGSVLFLSQPGADAALAQLR